MNTRFVVEERSGIVAILDTEHEDYQVTPGLSRDYPWVVSIWLGSYDPIHQCWSMDECAIENAHRQCQIMNTVTKG